MTPARIEGRAGICPRPQSTRMKDSSRDPLSTGPVSGPASDMEPPSVPFCCLTEREAGARDSRRRHDPGDRPPGSLSGSGCGRGQQSTLSHGWITPLVGRWPRHGGGSAPTVREGDGVAPPPQALVKQRGKVVSGSQPGGWAWEWAEDGIARHRRDKAGCLSAGSAVPGSGAFSTTPRRQRGEASLVGAKDGEVAGADRRVGQSRGSDGGPPACRSGRRGAISAMLWAWAAVPRLRAAVAASRVCAGWSMCAPFFRVDTCTRGLVRQSAPPPPPSRERCVRRDRLRRRLRGTSGPAGRPDARRPVAASRARVRQVEVHDKDAVGGRRGRSPRSAAPEVPGGQGRAHRARGPPSCGNRMVKAWVYPRSSLRGYSTGRPRNRARTGSLSVSAEIPRRSRRPSPPAFRANLVRTKWRIMSKPPCGRCGQSMTGIPGEGKARRDGVLWPRAGGSVRHLPSLPPGGNETSSVRNGAS